MGEKVNNIRNEDSCFHTNYLFPFPQIRFLIWGKDGKGVIFIITQLFFPAILPLPLPLSPPHPATPRGDG